MNVLIIDSQGGGIGKQLIPAVREARPEAVITAVGTNTMATSAMLKAGADHAATGADVILGPIGIVIADALFGEITPGMALAVAQSGARRILIPLNHCDNIVVGTRDLSMGELIREAVGELPA